MISLKNNKGCGALRLYIKMSSHIEILHHEQFLFFDIPVYRLNEEKYNKHLMSYISAFLDQPNKKIFFEKNPEQKDVHRVHAFKAFGGIWRYNEIIGYIRLYILGTQIRGEYFVNDCKRHVKTRKKHFKSPISNKLVSEIELPLSQNNADIYEAILLYLGNCKKELSNHFIDLSLFQKIGPHVDWKSLFK